MNDGVVDVQKNGETKKMKRRRWYEGHGELCKNLQHIQVHVATTEVVAAGKIDGIGWINGD